MEFVFSAAHRVGETGCVFPGLSIRRFTVILQKIQVKMKRSKFKVKKSQCIGENISSYFHFVTKLYIYPHGCAYFNNKISCYSNTVQHIWIHILRKVKFGSHSRHSAFFQEIPEKYICRLILGYTISLVSERSFKQIVGRRKF